MFGISEELCNGLGGGNMKGTIVLQEHDCSSGYYQGHGHTQKDRRRPLSRDEPHG